MEEVSKRALQFVKDGYIILEKDFDGMYSIVDKECLASTLALYLAVSLTEDVERVTLEDIRGSEFDLYLVDSWSTTEVLYGHEMLSECLNFEHYDIYRLKLEKGK